MLDGPPQNHVDASNAGLVTSLPSIAEGQAPIDYLKRPRSSSSQESLGAETGSPTTTAQIQRHKRPKFSGNDVPIPAHPAVERDQEICCGHTVSAASMAASSEPSLWDVGVLCSRITDGNLEIAAEFLGCAFQFEHAFNLLETLYHNSSWGGEGTNGSGLPILLTMARNARTCSHRNSARSLLVGHLKSRPLKDEERFLIYALLCDLEVMDDPRVLTGPGALVLHHELRVLAERITLLPGEPLALLALHYLQRYVHEDESYTLQCPRYYPWGFQSSLFPCLRWCKSLLASASSHYSFGDITKAWENGRECGGCRLTIRLTETIMLFSVFWLESSIFNRFKSIYPMEAANEDMWQWQQAPLLGMPFTQFLLIVSRMVVDKTPDAHSLSEGELVENYLSAIDSLLGMPESELRLIFLDEYDKHLSSTPRRPEVIVAGRCTQNHVLGILEGLMRSNPTWAPSLSSGAESSGFTSFQAANRRMSALARAAALFSRKTPTPPASLLSRGSVGSLVSVRTRSSADVSEISDGMQLLSLPPVDYEMQVN